MHCLRIPYRLYVTLVAFLMCCQLFPPAAFAKSPMKLQKLSGEIDFSGPGVPSFVLEGNASHIGLFMAYGEVLFVPGEDEEILVGQGPIVFEAANGDLLVGTASWDLNEDAGNGHLIHVSWSDSVHLSDGTIVSTTGRFVNDRPPGIVTVEYLVLGTFLALALIVGGRVR